MPPRRRRTPARTPAARPSAPVPASAALRAPLPVVQNDVKAPENAAPFKAPSKAPRSVVVSYDDDKEDVKDGKVVSDDANYRKMSQVSPGGERTALQWFLFWYGLGPNHEEFDIVWDNPDFVVKALKINKKPPKVSWESWRKQRSKWNFTVKDLRPDIVEGLPIPLWTVVSPVSIKPNKKKVDIAALSTQLWSHLELPKIYEIGIGLWTRIIFFDVKEWSDIQPPFTFGKNPKAALQRLITERKSSMSELLLTPMTLHESELVWGNVESGMLLF